MNTNHCILTYTWRVIKNNRWVGYVVSPSERDALRQATTKFGSHVWVERLRVGCLS